MLRDLLDTNICIDVIKERPPSMLESFHRHSGHMAISAITLSELLQCCPMAPRYPCITARSALPWNAGECRSA